eukprot:1159633-Pelagomonas_calceolata.AAC.8
MAYDWLLDRALRSWDIQTYNNIPLILNLTNGQLQPCALTWMRASMASEVSPSGIKKDLATCAATWSAAHSPCTMRPSIKVQPSCRRCMVKAAASRAGTRCAWRQPDPVECLFCWVDCMNKYRRCMVKAAASRAGTRCAWGQPGPVQCWFCQANCTNGCRFTLLSFMVKVQGDGGKMSDVEQAADSELDLMAGCQKEAEQ